MRPTGFAEQRQYSSSVGERGERRVSPAASRRNAVQQVAERRERELVRARSVCAEGEEDRIARGAGSARAVEELRRRMPSSARGARPASRALVGEVVGARAANA